jgi:hypothetical protein
VSKSIVPGTRNSPISRSNRFFEYTNKKYFPLNVDEESELTMAQQNDVQETQTRQNQLPQPQPEQEIPQYQDLIDFLNTPIKNSRKYFPLKVDEESDL